MAARHGRLRLSLEDIELALRRGGTPKARQDYLVSLRGQIAQYERQYDLPSALLRQALTSKKLQENLDVVKWTHAYETLRDLESGGKARLEQPGELPRSRAASAT